MRIGENMRSKDLTAFILIGLLLSDSTEAGRDYLKLETIFVNDSLGFMMS